MTAEQALKEIRATGACLYCEETDMLLTPEGFHVDHNDEERLYACCDKLAELVVGGTPMKVYVLMREDLTNPRVKHPVEVYMDKDAGKRSVEKWAASDAKSSFSLISCPLALDGAVKVVAE